MSSKPLTVTVITVCFNCATTLGRALQSVASQDWPFIEHIVIDGASTDDTIAIIKRHQASISQFISEPDQGIYDAMNKGLALATGDIVCFLNADDFYASTDVLSLAAKTIKSQQLDALIGDVGFFRADDCERTVRRYRSDRFTPQKLAWGWMPAHPALFMRRSIFERIGYFKTDYQIAGDYEHVVRAFSSGTLHYQHLPVVLVRMQMGGVSTTGIRATLRLNQEILRACRENGVSTNYLKIFSKYPAKILEFLNI